MSPIRPLRYQLQDQLTGELARASADCGRDVHRARTRCKKLRATLRLLREPLGERYGAANCAVRDAARMIAGRREQDVAAALCRTLDARFPDSGWQCVAAGLDRPVDAEDGYAIADARRLLDELRAALEAQPLPPLTPEDLARGLREGYRRARKGLRTAHAHPVHPEALHEWRKDAKYHMHQCELLAPLWPALKPRRKKLARLCDALGDHHDRHTSRIAWRSPQTARPPASAACCTPSSSVSRSSSPPERSARATAVSPPAPSAGGARPSPDRRRAERAASIDAATPSDLAHRRCRAPVVRDQIIDVPYYSVYASQPGSLPQHARLGTGRWLTCAGSGLPPDGIPQGDFRL